MTGFWNLTMNSDYGRVAGFTSAAFTYVCAETHNDAAGSPGARES